MSEEKKKEQSLSEAYEELEQITGEFERGEVDLEQGIPKFKRGLELAKHLKTRLSAIENEIEEIKEQFQEPEEKRETGAVMSAKVTQIISQEDIADDIPF